MRYRVMTGLLALLLLVPAAVGAQLCEDYSSVPNPSPISSFQTYFAKPLAIACEGNFAYVGYGNERKDLWVWDLSDPAVPVLVGQVGMFSRGITGLSVDGDLLYATFTEYVTGEGTYGGLAVFDISNPGGPSFLGSDRELAIHPERVEVAYPLAWARDYLYGPMLVFNVSDPSHPWFYYEVGYGDPKSFSISGNHVYVLDSYNNETTVKVYDADSSMYLGQWDPIDFGSCGAVDENYPGLMGSLTTDGDRAYVTLGRYVDGVMASGTAILDISDPLAPVYLGCAESGLAEVPNMGPAVARGRYLYVDFGSIDAAASGLGIFDVMDPAQATLEQFIPADTGSDYTWTRPMAYGDGFFLQGAENRVYCYLLQCDPPVIDEDSVRGMIPPDGEGGQYWKFIWETAYWSDPALDWVNVRDDLDLREFCPRVKNTVLTGTTPGVTATCEWTGEAWLHTLIWDHDICVTGCRYLFWVGSERDGLFTQSEEHSMSIKYCAMIVEPDPPGGGRPFKLVADPNPFNPATVLRFQLPETARDVSLAIYDARGRKVRELVVPAAEEGWVECPWDGRDGRGAVQSSGIYYARLLVDGEAFTSKLGLIK